jgi:hypothetical protein
MKLKMHEWFKIKKTGVDSCLFLYVNRKQLPLKRQVVIS